MARIRTIKPEFPQSETIGRLSRDARLLFIQLWTIVDDEGRARGSSRMLASLLYPYDNDAPKLMQRWLDELQQSGCIRQYEEDGAKYLEIINWLKHQKIDKPSKSRLPAFVEFPRILANVIEASATDLVPSTVDLGPGPKKENCPKRVRTIYSDDFENLFWKPYPTTPIMAKKEAFREWQKLTPEQRTTACSAVPGFVAFLKANPTHSVVHACRFLSQGRGEGFKPEAPSERVIADMAARGWSWISDRWQKTEAA